MAGVAGVFDLTPDVLMGITTLEQARDFAKLDQPTFDKLLATLGGPADLGEFYYVPTKDLQDCLDKAIYGLNGDEPLTPVVKGRVWKMQHAISLKVGPPVHASATADKKEPPAGANPGPADRKVRLSSLVDVTADADLVSLSPEAVRKAFATYQEKRGAPPHKDIEPTEDQLSAVAQQIRSGVVPYVDFALFGPHGRRMQKKLSHTAHTYHAPSGTWKRQELPGPADFDSWWRSWQTYKCCLLLLEAVKPEPLDLYGEMIRSLSHLYGPECWYIVYQADTRMRSEEFERIRSNAEIEHVGLTRSIGDRAACDQLGFDPKYPWDGVFRRATRADTSQEFWSTEVKDKALLHLSRAMPRSVITDDGTVLGTNKRRAQFALEQHPSKSPKGKGKGKGKLDQPVVDICNNWNSKGCPDPCPFGRRHICRLCHQPGHTKDACPLKGKGKGQKAGSR